MQAINFPVKSWAQDSAQFLCSKIISAAFPGPRVSVMLTGGRCAKSLYEQLEKEPRFHKIKGVDFYLSDERWVPSNNIESNYKMVMDTLFFKGVPQDCTFSAVDTTSLSIEQAAKIYNDQIPRNIDILILGVGEDGHIASLFKNSKALIETTQKVLDVLGDKAPTKRVTISPVVIKNAKSIYVLACNAEKVQVFEKVRKGGADPLQLPAVHIKSATWLLATENS